MDPNANAGNAGPVNSPPVPPAGPAAPGAAGDNPDHGAEVSALKSWLRENAASLIFTAIIIGLVIYYLDPIDTLKVVIGLGFIIFIHELGHFLAAKWCDVHVRTFSIGFGPAVPFCQYKWGETTYMIGIIPLGGYVAMVGEGDNAGDEDAEEDPRSFRHKTVGQRMLIISAGVVMNIIFGLACFAAAYMHGVREEPATLGSVVPGGAAWRAGMRTDDHITKINSRERPTFKDLRPFVMSTRKGETVEVSVERAGNSVDFKVEPLREEGAYFPTLGIQTQSQLRLAPTKKGNRPVVPGTPAAAANPGFEPGDRIIAMTDLDPAKGVTPLRADPRESDGRLDFNDYQNRLQKLAGQPVTIRIVRKDAPNDSQPLDITLAPTYRADLGLRMRMGRVAALRAGGPADTAKVLAVNPEQPTQGDRIKTVKLPEVSGKQTWLTTGEVKAEPGAEVRKLDPVLLPLELKKWADRNPGDLKVKLEVLRHVGHEENKSVELEVAYDRGYRNDHEILVLPNTPASLGGLGLAYWVEAVVDEVAPGGPAAGQLNVGDLVTAVRLKTALADGSLKPGEWSEIKHNQWANADYEFQKWPPYEIDLKVKRGEEVIEVTLKGREDKNWPTEERGLVLQADFRIQKATDLGDAMRLGGLRTTRFIKEVYMNLYGMIFGRVSAKTMSGPLSIAQVSYKFAGEDFWQFLLFLGMISVNLAVVNFLPIPVLDGGHMVFLILEKILGRPVPERLFAIAMYTGLALILALMVFVLTLDISRIWF